LIQGPDPISNVGASGRALIQTFLVLVMAKEEISLDVLPSKQGTTDAPESSDRSLSYYHLFRFATPLDWTLMVVGAIAACLGSSIDSSSIASFFSFFQYHSWRCNAFKYQDFWWPDQQHR
jgi:hypothetical protein